MSSGGHPAPLEDAQAALRALQQAPGTAREAGIRAALAQLSAAIDALTLERTSIAGKTAGLEMQAERERDRSNTLARASETVNSSLDLPTVLRRVLDLAIDVMQAERGFLVLSDPNAHTLQVAVLHNIERPELESDSLKISKSIVNKVLETGDAIITTDAQSDPRFNLQNSIVSLHIRSIVCVPLKVRLKVIGVVYLDSRVVPGLFTRRDPELLMSIANQAALAIENARLFAHEHERVKKISELEAFQVRILESIASGVITLDPERKITTFNTSAAETFAVPAISMLGSDVGSLETLIPGINSLIDRFAAGGMREIRSEIGAVNERRGDLKLELRIAALSPADGEQQGIAIVIDDRTAQRELEAEHQKDIVHRREIEASFSRYVAPHVVQTLMGDPQELHLGGERVLATMLFADIRGFTAMSAKMRPEDVVDMLNTYLDRAVAAVFAHEGLLDKFYGDGMMAVFGPPRVRPDDAARAIKTALRLHRVVDALAPQLRHKLDISVGLATGEVVAGNIGSDRRMEYTVIGDAVNLSSRLQHAAPPGAIFCDERTYRDSKLNYPAEKLSARIKGRDDLVTIYSLKF